MTAPKDDKQALREELFKILDEYYDLKCKEELGIEPENKIISLIDAYTEQRVIVELEKALEFDQRDKDNPFYDKRTMYAYLSDRLAQLKASTREGE